MSTRLGTLGFHLDARPCRVGCEFCYLGARPDAPDQHLSPETAAAIVARAPARDIAVAISEPAAKWRTGLLAVRDAATARGLPVAVTTTAAVIERDPWVLDGISRLNLSVDPVKGEVNAQGLASLLGRVVREGLEVVALVSLVSPEFTARLADGLLAEVLAIPTIDLVGMNGLKPPPPWCDRAFWLRLLGKIRPLLDEHLGRRLHLDCYVNARILGLSGCPAKPDIAGREFRACVYQARADFTFVDADDLAARTAAYEAPATCPFVIA